MGCEYVVFHDIDQLPTNPENNYQVHRAGPLHMCTNTTQYTELGSVDLQPHVGGALMMSRRDYIRVNGFSNRYWRWGHEDSENLGGGLKGRGFSHAHQWSQLTLVDCAVALLEQMVLLDQMVLNLDPLVPSYTMPLWNYWTLWSY